MQVFLPALRAALSACLIGSILVLTGCQSMMSPAVEAIRDNDMDGLKRALDSGLSPDYVESNDYLAYRGYSLVGVSALFGRTEIAELLFQRGADPRKAAPSVFRAMELMEEAPALSAVRMLLDKGLDPSQTLANNVTPIHLSCRQPRVAELLLAKGARADDLWVSPNQTSSETPLAGCLTQISSLHGAIKSLESSTSGLDFRSAIAMHVKWRDRTIDTALLLLQAGANPDAKVTAPGGTTPLFFKAFATAQPRIIQAMLERGADVMASQEPRGVTVLHVAAEQRNTSGAREMLARAKAAAIKKTGTPEEADALFFAWVNKPFDAGYTALHMAAHYGAVDIIPLLIDAGADPSLRTKEGKTALDLARANNQTAAFNALARSPQLVRAVPLSSQLIAQLNALTARNDLPGLRAFLDMHPETLSLIKDAPLRLRLTGPAELRIADIEQLAKSRKKDALIIARINSAGGPYKKFSDGELDDLQKMSISDEVVAAMISITTQYDKEQKRLAEQQRASQAAAQQVAQAPIDQQPQQAPANNTPAACLKLVAAIKACDRTGGLMAMGCKTMAKSQFDCPIPVERLMR